jgi:hypothetical protein
MLLSPKSELEILLTVVTKTTRTPLDSGAPCNFLCLSLAQHGLVVSRSAAKTATGVSARLL